MSWFTTWFDGLTLLQQIFACVALPATVVLAIQTVLLILGLGFGDGDADGVDCDCGDPDCDIDGDIDASDYGVDDAAGIRIFTVRGLVAMFAVGGWMGIAAVDLGAANWLATLIAVLSGVAALVLIAYVIKLLLRLQESGNLEAKNAIAHTAQVYITIPAARRGTGKVMLTLQERLVEMDAVTDYGESIKTDCMVQVVSVVDNVLVVRPITGAVE